MKKFLAITILLLVAIPLFATTKMQLELGVQNADISLNYQGDSGTVKFNAELDLGMNVIFDEKNGFNLVFAPNLTGNSFTFGGGYIYQTKIGDSTKLLLSAGPRANIKSSSWSLGVDLSAALQLNLTSKVYISVSTGTVLYVAKFEKGNTKAYIDLTIPLPKIAIGYTF